MTHEIPTDFSTLPLVTEGESKEIRYVGDGNVAIRLKPTIYSYTHNRSGTIPGSEMLRLRAAKALLPVVQTAGVMHTYQSVDETGIVSRLVLQPNVTGDTPAFRPTDMTAEELADFPKATPLEVVVKAIHSGTPKHRYYRFSDYPLRDGSPVATEAPYPEQIVRFDWRNPLHDSSGTRLADEVLPESMAAWFIDVAEAKRTALTAFDALSKFLGAKGLELWDICFFIAEDGRTMFGEISPDCMRVRAANGSSLDKDVWRQGGSSENVLEKWQQFVEIIETT